MPPDGEAESGTAPTVAASTDPVVAPPAPPWSQGPNVYSSSPPTAIRWDLAWRGALLCGVGAAILSAIPFVSLGCCLWMLGAGALCVSLYARQIPGVTVTPGMGMKVGALAGLIGFVVNAIVTTASFVARRSSGELQQAMQEQMKKQIAGTPDPQVQQAMQRMLDWMSTPQGAATMIVLVLIFMGFVFVIFTAAGGALGASMSSRRREFR